MFILAQAVAEKAVIPQVWAYLIPIALSLLVFALVYLAFGPLRSLLVAKASQNRFGAIGIRVLHLAEAVVRDLEVTLKPQLEEKAKDGLTMTEIKELRDAALARLKAFLGENGLKELTAAIGVLGGSSIDAYLSGIIEKAVASQGVTPTEAPAPAPK